MTMKNIAQQKQATMEMIAQAREKIVIEKDTKTKAVKELAEKRVGDKKKARIIVKHKNTKLLMRIEATLISKATARVLTESQGLLVESYIAADEHLSLLAKQRESLMKDMSE